MLSLCYARVSKTYSASQIILKQHISWVLHGVCVLIFSFLFLVKKKPIHSFFHVFICCFSACGQIGVLSKMVFLKRLKNEQEKILNRIMKCPQIKDVDEEAY